MLQRYQTDASLLLDDYSKEYARDMSEIASKVSVQVEPTEVAPDVEHVGDSLSIDPERGDQNWRKTESGWERIDDPDDPADEPEETSGPAPPGWAKKLYRKIALIAHPDRMSEDFEEARLRKIFLETSDAMSEGKFEKLLGFALELGIPSTDDDATVIPLLKKRVEGVKEEIAQIESSEEWLWGESLGVPAMRVAIASAYLSRKGIAVKSEELLSIIQELEKDSDKPRDT